MKQLRRKVGVGIPVDDYNVLRREAAKQGTTPTELYRQLAEPALRELRVKTDLSGSR